jgi:hypothetical protein
VGRWHHRAGGDAAGGGPGVVGGAECADTGDEVWGVSDVGAHLPLVANDFRAFDV